MLNFEPNYWYVYIIKNDVSGWLYIGLHHQVSNKSYSNSSSSVLLKEAIDSGITSEYIVWKGKNAEKAAALETHLINLAKTYNYDLYNMNCGGGYKGGARPEILTSEDCNLGENFIIYKNIPKPVYNDDEVDINAKIREISSRVRDAVKDMHDNKPNPFKVHYIPVDIASKMDFLQVRENHIDNDNVEKVVESMRIDMKKAEYLVEPLSLVVFPDGKLLRLDGTSTLNAIIKINKWAKVPVVYLNSSLFHDNEIYMEVYAAQRNAPEKHKGANDPKKELKARIRNFHLANSDLFKDNIEVFQRKFISLYKGAYSDQQMRSNLSHYIKNVQEHDNRGENWLDYRPQGHQLLKAVAAKIIGLFPGAEEYTHVAMESLDKIAPGSNLNYFANTSGRNKKIAITIAEHTTHKSEGKNSYYLDRYTKSLAEAGFFPDTTKAKYGYTPYVSKITGKQIFVFVLPCRVNTRKRIDSEYIFQQLFDDEAIAA